MLFKWEFLINTIHPPSFLIPHCSYLHGWWVASGHTAIADLKFLIFSLFFLQIFWDRLVMLCVGTDRSESLNSPRSPAERRASRVGILHLLDHCTSCTGMENSSPTGVSREVAAEIGRVHGVSSPSSFFFLKWTNPFSICSHSTFTYKLNFFSFGDL